MQKLEKSCNEEDTGGREQEERRETHPYGALHIALIGICNM